MFSAEIYNAAVAATSDKLVRQATTARKLVIVDRKGSRSANDYLEEMKDALSDWTFTVSTGAPLTEEEIKDFGLVVFKDEASPFLFEGSAFSNFQTIDLTVNGRKFTSVEQAFQYAKCVFAHQIGDADLKKTATIAAFKIMSTSAPDYMLKASREVAFNETQTFCWQQINKDILRYLVALKFEQNPKITDDVHTIIKVLGLSSVEFWECNKFDTYYGMGKSLFNALACDDSNAYTLPRPETHYKTVVDKNTNETSLASNLMNNNIRQALKLDSVDTTNFKAVKMLFAQTVFDDVFAAIEGFKTPATDSVLGKRPAEDDIDETPKSSRVMSC